MPRAAASKFQSQKGTTIYKFHGSVFGNCLHAQVEALNGVEPNDDPRWAQQVFARGHEVEEEVKQTLREQGYHLTHAQSSDMERQLELCLWHKREDGSYILLASHIDGMIAPNPMAKSDVLEVKSMEKRRFEKFRRSGLAEFRTYAYQVSAAIHGARAHFKDPDIRCVVVARQSGSENDAAPPLDSHLSLDAPYTLEECFARCEEAIQHHLAGTVPACDNEYKCRYLDERSEAEPCDDPEVVQRTAEFVSIREAAQQLSSDLEVARAQLVEAIKVRSGTKAKLLVSGHLVRFGIDKRGRENLAVTG